MQSQQKKRRTESLSNFYPSSNFDNQTENTDDNEKADSLSENGTGSVSEATNQTEPLQDTLEQNTVVNDMDTLLEFLGSHDSIERIDALEKITHLLCRRLFDDYFDADPEKKIKDWSEMLNQCLKKGDATEQCLALQTVELVAVTLQSDLRLFFQEIRGILIKLILEATNTRVQIMALNAFTYLVWLCDSSNYVQSTLQFLEKLWKAPITDEAKAAVSMLNFPPLKPIQEDQDEEKEKTNGQESTHVSNGTHSENTDQNETTSKQEDTKAEEIVVKK